MQDDSRAKAKRVSACHTRQATFPRLDARWLPLLFAFFEEKGGMSYCGIYMEHPLAHQRHLLHLYRVFCLALLYWCTKSNKKGVRSLSGSPKGFRAPGLQHIKTGAPGLHSSTPGLHLARISIFVRVPSSKRLWAPGFTTKLSGLQGFNSPPPPLRPRLSRYKKAFGSRVTDSLCRLRVVSNFGDGDLWRAPFASGLLKISRARVCVFRPPHKSPSPKLETTRSLFIVLLNTGTSVF